MSGIEFILQREQQETMKQLYLVGLVLCCCLALVAIGAFVMHKSSRLETIKAIKLAKFKRARPFPANLPYPKPS